MSKESNWNRSLLSKREKVEKEQKEQTKKELYLTQHANFRGKLLFQAPKQQLKNS